MGVLEQIADGVFMLDREGRFTYMNRSAEQLFRRFRCDLIGRGVWEGGGQRPIR